jgi:hypothetical protein
VNAPRVGKLPGLAELERIGQILGAIERLQLDTRVGESPRVSGSDDRCDAEIALASGTARALVGRCHRPGKDICA